MQNKGFVQASADEKRKSYIGMISRSNSQNNYMLTRELSFIPSPEKK